MSAFTDLRDSKVGDLVMVVTGGWSTSLPSKRTVIKATANQVTLDDGTRWLRRGRKIGQDSLSRVHAKPWDEAEAQAITQEHQAAIRKNKVCRFFDGRSCNDLTPDEWLKVEALCDAVNTRAKAAKP